MIFLSREPKCASAGNWTRASRVAGENSTTEPPMLHEKALSLGLRSFSRIVLWLYFKKLSWSKIASPAGNWTRVFRVTGGNTNHYTTADMTAAWHFSYLSVLYLCHPRRLASNPATKPAEACPVLARRRYVDWNMAWQQRPSRFPFFSACIPSSHWHVT